ncbi:SDR family NAD(P)-dependent oxidoreductase [Zhongshania aquimaris]|uniref:SDR family NAD(P)-dependent oxidoreductase n=1 Tax=Zhongshania aquimaris TaxID=2857107 RepID=A0ABS6VV20_9GAMM|nr:SDR family NAD(P)-dependent oxidoreductase [Zhongshania aquimaris]MBW2942185.1 SDR family NAD(P)-dependent oxidoreductase [Zhongshania aquimaris]
MIVDKNTVALVTGASRGVGKGIALALADAGATIYITGRSVSDGQSSLPGTIFKTVEEINARGGKGVAMACDHRSDEQVQAVFDKIETDHGKLDILVNNVFVVPDDLMEYAPFWEKKTSYWDDMIDVGLRAHYISSVFAAKMMVKAKSGLIVNISSFGSRCYIHTPVYGVSKAGVDKMAHDMAKDLKEYNVACVSLWLGIVKTERTTTAMDKDPATYEYLKPGIESPEYPGRIIIALLKAGQIMEKTGKTYVTAELGEELNVLDVDGKIPTSYAPMMGSPAQPSDVMVT